MSTSKRVVVFTRRPLAIVCRLLAKLRECNYHIMMVVCAPGSNGALPTTAIPSIGSLIAGIIDQVDDPPPVLCITRMSQVESIYLALDPDMALACEFPYRITRKMLSHRAKFVNYHCTPLPTMRGSPTTPWLVLDPSIPMFGTWHYMVEGVDEGNIIRTANGVVPEGKTRETMTAIEVENAIQEPFFATMAGVLRQVEEGDEGRVQVHASGRDSWGSRPLRDDERTLKDDMDVEEVMRLGRALEGLPIRPLVRFDGGLYHVMRLTRMGEEDRKPVGTQKRIGLDLIQYFKGGAVRMAVRKI